MKTQDFNAEARSPKYGYVKSPVHPRAFMILKYKADRGSDPHPVGDYTVLDADEDLGLSERKVMNIVTLLNGRKGLMPLGEGTGSRMLYNQVTECDDDGKSRVVFYRLGEKGVSTENALLRMESAQ